MTKIVLDTNVYISGMLRRDGTCGQIFKTLLEKEAFIMVISSAIILEITRVLRYKKIREKYYIEKAFLKDLVNASQIVPGQLEINVIKEDPSDNKFLICALEGKADYLVTGDKHLLNLGTYKGTKIISPKDFKSLIESDLGKDK